MATSNAPLPPPRANNTVVAVVIGIVAVFAIIIGGGVFVVGSLIQGTRIRQLGHGPNQRVEIHSPLGDLNVHGQGDSARVDIQSPFGSLHVDPHPDLARLDMPVYPGATQVTSTAGSPFHEGGDTTIEGLNGVRFSDGAFAGAEVEMHGENGQMTITVAEFVTPASPAEVEGYYRRELARYGSVATRFQNGAQRLKVKLSDTDQRVAAVKSGADGTHFLLVRIIGGSSVR